MKENFDFATLENENFKEDSVREFIIAPLLQKLGFALKGSNKQESKLEMVLSMRLSAPTITGSNEKIVFDKNTFPDYVLYVDSKPHCVLDAKAPKVKIDSQSKAER